MKNNLLKKLVIGVLVSVQLMAPSSYAMSKDNQDFYANNDILYYDPDAAKACRNGDAIPDDSSFLTTEGNDNLDRVMRFFYGKGLTVAAAAGIAGNLKQESQFNPRLIEGGKIATDDYVPQNGKGFGLAQWTYDARQKPLIAYAKSVNKPITDLDMQLNFIWKELTTGYKTSTLDRLKNETDPGEAAFVFHKYYEVSADTKDMIQNNRIKPAIQYHDKYKSILTGTSADGVTDPTSPTSTPSNSSATSTPAATSYKTIALGNIPAEGIDYGATLYGGNFSNGAWRPDNKQQNGGTDDNGMGNDGVPLPGKTAYAELDMGKAMGGLPQYTKLLITYKGRSLVAEKRDIGGGGGPIEGKKRAIDLWWETARMLDMKDSAVVNVKVLDPKTPVTPYQEGVVGEGPVATTQGTESACLSSNSMTTTAQSDGSKATFVTKDGYAVYIQTDPRWANTPYSTKTIGSSACGPASMTMIITALTGKAMDIKEVAKKAADAGMYVQGVGSSWEVGPYLAKQYGLKSVKIPSTPSDISPEHPPSPPSVEAVNKVLRAGGYILISGSGPVPFTSAGHFIHIRGITASGKWLVGDSAHKDANETEWDPAHIRTYSNADNYIAIYK